jgi:hypothetical protein
MVVKNQLLAMIEISSFSAPSSFEPGGRRFESVRARISIQQVSRDFIFLAAPFASAQVFDPFHACECSVTTPTSGGALWAAGLADEHAVSIETQTRPSIDVRLKAEILRWCIMRSASGSSRPGPVGGLTH